MNNLPLQEASKNQIPLEGKLLPLIPHKTITITQQEYIDLKWRASYWEMQHSRVTAREAQLKEKLKHKEAIIRDLNQRLYGKTSEKGVSRADNPNEKNKKSSRARGRQKGSASHGRTARPNLAVIPEVISLSETACAKCGLEYSILSNYEESAIIEIEVAAHVRRIKRQKCVKNCTCSPGKIITAPQVPKLIPKSPYGNSIWEEILLRKFLYAQPINRILHDFKSLGLNISPGTIAGGLKKLAPLFTPVYKAFHQQQMTENRFHNDETRWEVYEAVAGKTGSRWYLWLTRSKTVVYYRMDPTRSSEVPIAHFVDLISKAVIVICDRYSAYKKLARRNLAITLAFCWAHVRRDFLNLARSHPNLSKWGLDWAEEISKLFHLNNQRIKTWDSALPLAWQSTLFKEKHDALGVALNEMKLRASSLIEEDDKAKKENGKTKGTLATIQRKILDSLCKHWKGLTVFYEYPDVTMDNNPAEESMRKPVLGRNGYYGSGSLWSAQLAAMQFSIVQTMLLWNLNPRTWLHLYLEACVKNRGSPPEDLSEFLPWQMNEARLLHLSKPPQEDSS
jgi:transposase